MPLPASPADDVRSEREDAVVPRDHDYLLRRPQRFHPCMTRVTGVAPWSPHAAWLADAVLAVPALLLVLRYRRRGQDVAALCVTACFGLLLAPVSWLPCWVWTAPALIALFSWLQATWRGAGWGRWVRLGAVMAVIAVFAGTYSVPISEQRNRTVGSFWFFVLSNPYVLTAIAIALALGVAGVLPEKREKFLL